MIPVLITSILTVCYFLSIALVYKAIVSGKSDLTIFYLIFPIALPFFGAGLIHMISKPNPGRHRRGQEAAVGGKIKDLTIDLGISMIFNVLRNWLKKTSFLLKNLSI